MPSFINNKLGSAFINNKLGSAFCSHNARALRLWVGEVVVVEARTILVALLVAAVAITARVDRLLVA